MALRKYIDTLQKHPIPTPHGISDRMDLFSAKILAFGDQNNRFVSWCPLHESQFSWKISSDKKSYVQCSRNRTSSWVHAVLIQHRCIQTTTEVKFTWRRLFLTACITIVQRIACIHLDNVFSVDILSALSLASNLVLDNHICPAGHCAACLESCSVSLHMHSTVVLSSSRMFERY